MLKKSDPVERILLQHKKISEKSLQEIKAKQLHNGKYLGKSLVDHGFIHVQTLLSTLSEELGAPYLSKDDFQNKELPVQGLDIPETFLREKLVFPIEVSGNTLRIVMYDPFDWGAIENLKVSLGKEIKVCLASESDILESIELYYGGGASAMDRMVGQIDQDETKNGDDDENAEQIRDMASEAPVIKLVNHVITRGIEMGASDIHLEPFAEDLILRYRVDGILHEVESPPKRLNSAISTRIKIMAKLDISERRLPQDGRIKLKIHGKDIDMRVSTLPTLYGESVVMRILDRGALQVNLDHLGFPERELKLFEELIKKPYGKLLVTGPTGSGKTTTLYAALDKINTPDKKIITIEDPVEYQMKGVNQIHVRSQIGLSFAQGLRSIVRQDPDVIMVGEIRDSETADISIQAALTGHMVFSTVHTNDAAGAVSRLLDMGVQSYLLSSALLGVLAQRLVRIICEHCKEPVALPAQFVQEIGLGDKGKVMVFHGKGCKACNQTGFRGRVGIYELLIVDDEIRRLIVEKASSHVIRAAAMKTGMRRLRDDGWRKVLEGVTTVEEVLRVTLNDSV
ncbi:MAG: type II secretion system ATPase GspE [Candidatus Nitrohelix vancouverensis]|uniref:protein-secreting ATPase n=1 Tax=Candidatus Nitrohelix vancouverensis TaxID=2705534 RepID=A0A7T0C478_9BACT|nr:MAG: type II secretion system ATPase GspE [Candidatus Nitrohelix vancouverensis]